MKNHKKSLLSAIALPFLFPATASAEGAGAEGAGGVAEEKPQVASKAPAKPKSKHAKLCQQLGLSVGRYYIFRLEAEKYHTYQVRSLGANGWVFMRDQNNSNIWVNLSQVISITPIVR